jgi:hypothetical protein
MTAVCKPGLKVFHKKDATKRIVSETKYYPGTKDPIPKELLGQPGHVGFDNPTTLVGTSKWMGSDGQPITVYYDPSLGNNGLALAKDILDNRIEDIMAACDAYYGVKGKSGNVIIIPGNGGAYHAGCSFNADGGGSDWYEDDMGTSPNPAGQPGGLVVGLVMAEVCESYDGLANKGIDCGGSGGEGQSRKMAEMVSGGITGAMSGGFSARSSYTGGDWISKDSGTDQDYDSTGCSMLFYDWMQSLGHTLKACTIIGEPGNNLDGVYAALTGKPKSQAFSDFQTALGKVNINDVNPFGIKDDPYPIGTQPGPQPGGSNTVKLDGKMLAGTYPISDASGNVLFNLVATSDVQPGTYNIDLSPGTTSIGTVTIGTAYAVGSYSVSGLGTMNVLAPLSAGTTFTIPGTPGAAGLTIPPWLLVLIKMICAVAEQLPPPLGTLAGDVCGLISASERGNPVTAFEQEMLAAYLKHNITVLQAKGPADVLALPPILLLILHLACTLSSKLPPPIGPLLASLCALLPAAKGGCGH